MFNIKAKLNTMECNCLPGLLLDVSYTMTGYPEVQSWFF